jgi:sugar/nucleoside kinase (ribokinase family)
LADLRNVIVAGHLCLDIIPDLSALTAAQFQANFLPGHLIKTGPAMLSTGGAVSNTGLALHKLGIPTRLLAKIGADLFGQAVLNIVRSHGGELAEGMVIDPAVSTSYTVIINPPEIDRIFLHNPGANDTFCAADLSPAALNQTHLFHFGYPTLMARMHLDEGAELTSLFCQAKEAGLTTSLDMSFPDPASPGGTADWPGIYARTLPYVDLFVPSFEELLFTLRRSEYDRLSAASSCGADLLNQASTTLLSDLSSELLSLGVKIVLLKLGIRGAYLRTAGAAALAKIGRGAPADLPAWADQELWAPSFQVEVVGTTGAGDASIAGFLSGFLRGLPPRAALRAAVAVGACNVEAADALSGIRSWEATLERISAGWLHHALEIKEQGWNFDQEMHVWHKTR